MPKDSARLNEPLPLEYGKRSFTWRDHLPSATDPKARWFPSVASVGAELLGAAERDHACRKTGRIDLPPLRKRVAIFLEMLSVIEESWNWSELFIAAGYRRQVTNIGGLARIDRRLWDLALQAKPPLSSVECMRIAERMPKKSLIRQGFLYLAKPKLLAPPR